MSWVKAKKADDLPAGGMVAVGLEDDDVVLVRLENGEVYAVEDRCSHDGASFDGGILDGATLACPRHGALFDVMNGKALRMPAVAPIETYPIRLTDDGWIEVDLEDE